MPYVIKINRKYSFKRRIPKQFKHLYPEYQSFVKTSLSTDSKEIAEKRSQLLNARLEEIWHQAALNNDNDIESDYVEAVKRCRLSGFNYRTSEDISRKDIEEIVARIISAKDSNETSPDQIRSILGFHEAPSYPISQALQDHIAFEMPNLLNKSENQVRKWKNPRSKAINNFVAVCGDLDVEKITRQDMLKIREWWHDRIKRKNMSANSANKDFGYISQTLAYARDDKNLKIEVAAIMTKLRFTEKESTRPPFKASYIKETLLSDSNLNGLNEECRLFLYAMADTGARPSELVGLNAKNGDIRLDCDIPFIYIRPDYKKELKTAQSERQIPLVGASLYAFKQLSNGFDHYYRKSDQLSATLNKFLKERNLLPTKEHCVYSLRHSFEDRLTVVEPPEKVQAALMGHKYHRERYGKGPTLEQKKKWLEMMCFDIQ